jgi:hypothetical protein
VQLLEVGLVTTRPVGRLVRHDGPEHVEDAVEAFLVNDVADTHEVEVARRHPDHEVLLGDNAKNQVLLLFSLDGAHLDVFDDRGPVIWINDRFADSETHM